jgi:DEAD/DEAH box helicase domain-containing protein
MLRKIFFDIETSNIFSDVGKADPVLLDLSVVGIYDSDDNQYRTFLEKDLPSLWPILEKTDLLIGFNSEHFDIPLLNKYYPGELTQIRSLDILKEIKSSYGRRMKLEQIAEATLGTNKTGDGLIASRWWKEGEFQKVIDYCLEDVKITKQIYDFALENRHLKFKEGGQIITIPLDTSHWEETNDSKLTHTLPF